MGLDRMAIKELCDRTLAAVVDYWPNDAPPLPKRRYVSNGEVFWDAEQLVVAVERIFGLDGDVSAEQYLEHFISAGFRGMTVAVWLIRCVPDMEAQGDTATYPSVAKINASANETLGDSVTVWELLYEAQGRGDLTTEHGLAFESWSPAGPMGGFGGSVCRVRMLFL